VEGIKDFAMKRGFSPASNTTFKKFKLVPADEHEKSARVSIQNVQKLIRNYNPLLRGMANSYSGMQNAAHDKKRTSSAKDRLNLLNSNRARFLHLKKNSFYNNDEALQQQQELVESKNAGLYAEKTANVDESQWMEPEISEKSFEESEKSFKSLADTKPSSSTENLKWSKDKFTLLKDLVGNAIKPNRLGELMINNKTLRNASYDQVMRSLFVDENEEVPGLSQTVKELKRIGVPLEILGSKRARNLFQVVSPKQKGKGQFIGKWKAPVKARKVLRLY
jgi:hypothetical protein